MHEAPRHEPPGLSLEHLVAVHGPGLDDAADVRQPPDHELANEHQDAGQHQDEGHAGEDAHPGFEVDALLVEHVLADVEDLVLLGRGGLVLMLVDGGRRDFLEWVRHEGSHHGPDPEGTVNTPAA